MTQHRKTLHNKQHDTSENEVQAEDDRSNALSWMPHKETDHHHDKGSTSNRGGLDLGQKPGSRARDSRRTV